MNNTERTEVYLRNGRLIPIITYRPTGRGRWPRRLEYSDTDLVAIVSGEFGDIEIKQGPRANSRRVAEAVMLHLGITPSAISSRTWQGIPVGVKKILRTKIVAAQNGLQRQWSQISNEEMMTGVLFGNLNETFREGSWEVKMRYVEFSKQLKEPNTGADLALVLDVQNAAGQRAFKSIWLQAKKSANVPDDFGVLPRITDQFRQMGNFTAESYGLLYTPHGIYVQRQQTTEKKQLDELVMDALACTAGDARPELLANSLNKRHVFQILLNQQYAT